MNKADTLADLRSRIASLEDRPDCSVGHIQKQERLRTRKKRADGAKDAAQGSEGADAAFRKIVALVNVSDRSEKALRERLARDGFDDECVDHAVDRAKSYGFVDDARFAEVLIRSRLAQGRGSSGIERELARTHGIDPAGVEGWPFAFGVDDDSEHERAMDLLRRKPPRSKNVREGAFRRLIQKGYPVSVASAAAREWAESTEG